MLAGGRHTTIPHESPAPPHPYGTDKSVPYSRERIYAFRMPHLPRRERIYAFRNPHLPRRERIHPFRNPHPRKEHPLWNLFLMSSLIWY